MSEIDRLIDHEIRLRRLEEAQYAGLDHTHPELIVDVAEAAGVAVEAAVIASEAAEETIETVEELEEAVEAAVEEEPPAPAEVESEPEPQELAHSPEPAEEVVPDRAHFLHTDVRKLLRRGR